MIEMIPVNDVARIKMLNSFQEMVRHLLGIKYSRSMRYAEEEKNAFLGYRHCPNKRLIETYLL